MPAPLVPDVEPLGVNAQEPLHACHQVGFGRLHHQVKVVAHQAIGMHLPAGFLAGLAQSGEKARAVLLVAKNVFAAVAAIDRVINGPGIFKAQFAWHGVNLASPTAAVKEKVQIVRTDTCPCPCAFRFEPSARSLLVVDNLS